MPDRNIHHEDLSARIESKQIRKYKPIVAKLLLLLWLLYPRLSDIIHTSEKNNCMIASATSINYGIVQQPITDASQLMPKLCQNQTTICEGSFCIPNVRKCVCDLRMPVQFGRFCLRQVDIETKCFATNQCNHTVRDAVCIDINSNAILDTESSKFKLDQWQQLNELRQLSQSAVSRDIPKQQTQTIISQPKPMFFIEDRNFNGLTIESRDDVIVSNVRNSPYEININTPELLLQNHTRRRTNNTDRALTNLLNSVTPANFNPKDVNQINDKPSHSNSIADLNLSTMSINTNELRTTTRSIGTETHHTNTQPTIPETTTTTTNTISTDQPTEVSSKDFKSFTTMATTTTTTGYNDLNSRKKMIIKTPNWPPGVCMCPFGYMFDPMLRKCLALSLADSHCLVDKDCKQITSTHCSLDSKRCECDEPLVWNQKELACVRPKPSVKPDYPSPKKEPGNGLVENLLPPIVLGKLFPDYSMILLIFVIIVIIGTLLLLKLTVKCFSSSSSALISPKNKKKKKKLASSNLPPRSPYATLRRPDHKPNPQLSNFTQATRGRILNYDFEQEGPISMENDTSQSPQPFVNNSQKPNCERTCTMRSNHNNNNNKSQKMDGSLTKEPSIKVEEDDQLMELNDNISVSQLESESKSDNGILAIPGPPPTQPPPYMLKSAMMGQGSAIAAAAAAVANKRMQKKNLEQHSGRLANGSPVFL